nr:paramyosin isoform X1 [Tanacetum cinerariifolium]
AEQTKKKKKSASQKIHLMQQKIDKLSSVVLEEKKLSATLQTNLEKRETENETFKQVITKFYDIKQNSLEKYDDDVNWEDKCTSLLNDSDDIQTALKEEVEALRKSVNKLRSRQQMVCSEEKMKSDTLDLRSYHSQHRMDIVNLLEEEASQFKSVDDVKEYIRQICVNEELKHVSLQIDMSLQENDCRDVHVSFNVGSDTITKVYEYPLPYFAV